MKIYSVSYGDDSASPFGKICGMFFPTRAMAEADASRRSGSVIEELEFDDYSADARYFYETWPAEFTKPPFPVAIDNLMARYAGDDPAKRAEVLENAARVLRGLAEFKKSLKEEVDGLQQQFERAEKAGLL